MPEKPEIKNPDSTPAPVPFVAYESALASEREHSRRLFFVVCVLIAALVATNLAWLWAWTQYDYVSDSYAQDGGGVNMISGGDNHYGPDLQETPENPEG